MSPRRTVSGISILKGRPGAVSNIDWCEAFVHSQCMSLGLGSW